MISNLRNKERLISPSLTAKFSRWRIFKDKLARYYIVLGGISVIATVILIFFYLLYIVVPLFYLPQIKFKEIHLDYPQTTSYLGMNEENTIGLQLNDQGQGTFFSIENEKLLKKIQIPTSKNVEIKITSFATSHRNKISIYGLSDGKGIIFYPNYATSYTDSSNTPEITYPLGTIPIQIDPEYQPLNLVNIQADKEQIIVAAVTEDNRLVLTRFSQHLNELEEAPTGLTTIINLNSLTATHIIINSLQQALYLADSQGYLNIYQAKEWENPQLIQRAKAVPRDVKITALASLVGEISLLVGDSLGQISQWFPVKDNNNQPILSKVRVFNEQHAPIQAIISESTRKVFFAIDTQGYIGLYHATGHKTLKVIQITHLPLKLASLSLKGDKLLTVDSKNKIFFLDINNPYPEFSWQSLWNKIWYEDRQEPEFVWQSSAASDIFEPKFSLTPLLFGTFKAVFYAMIFSIPIAIMAAIYVAYFMGAKMRRIIKPAIETMAALPTVILGFVAGIWLAPIVEENLLSIFIFPLLLVITIFIFAYYWQYKFTWLRQWTQNGWEIFLLVPIIVGIGFLALSVNKPLEVILFNGDISQWISNHFGILYNQRNALIIGIAMGFTTIPLIFSISEDAIFSVPKHLTTGSLALGATPWQTLTRVVLLTASPGIFSAIMIGFGRTIGETMIVLMAAGNTPIMDFNPFQGLRTLSANIAVEIPEAEVGSIHYRILFFAALLLFIITFTFNTFAEIVRQKLRARYSTL
ncbi:ABC transporter permease subunit [Candidatus Nitrosacidococcus tergens]|uniref:Binding-protein-dependent transport systems inner membrane component n=1 Tax=Candidatus Nitrosacidococcus tergens TaxID=553981 RepID=A0A7G1Q822_9GAMM|nr:ABC transporter permease subunit [Candidatus Nitrosacidococcus tergens]CAB1274718.1 Binding-protein-dependent transport systems inner membrane component [Candidatus Nitrosacidococcus tergens]